MKTVKYSVVGRHNPQRPDEPAHYYAQAQSAGEMTLNEMSELIALICTVTKPDILAVLAALEITIIDSLSNGFIARLGELGSLRLTLRSGGVETEESFHASAIRKSFVRFTPGKNLKDMLKTLNYTQVSKLLVKKKEDGVEPEPEPED